MAQKSASGQGLRGDARAGAETLVLRALGWAAAQEPDEMPVFTGFLAQSGLSRDDLAKTAGEPEFLAAFLDFILTEDAWVLACAEGLGIPPHSLITARAALPGGEDVNWT